MTNDLPSVGTEDARRLADEMDTMSERITRYSNGPGDGLLAIGAETVRNLVSERDELRAACRAPLSEIEVNTGWKDSPAFTSIMGSRGQAFEAGVRFAELKHGIATLSVSERDELASRVSGLEGALRDVIVDCTHLHHAKKDRHTYAEPCPVEGRIRAALSASKEHP